MGVKLIFSLSVLSAIFFFFLILKNSNISVNYSRNLKFERDKKSRNRAGLLIRIIIELIKKKKKFFAPHIFKKIRIL